jgi:CBS domain-containing protein
VTSGPVIHTLVRALGAVPAFADLDEETLCSIVGASSNLVWRAGSCVFAPGEPAEALYIVLSGAVRITDEPGGEVARLGPGAFFGEHSLVRASSHSKGAEAVEDSELMVLPKDSFDRLLSEDPQLAETMRGRLRA